MLPYQVGDRVRKIVGDYTFVGFVVAIFQKRNGHLRVVVEHETCGMLHIFSPANLELYSDTTKKE